MLDKTPARIPDGQFAVNSLAETLYPPSICAVAVLLVGLTAARLPVTGYLATTTVQRAAENDGPAEPSYASTSAESADRLAARQLLRRQLTPQEMARMLMRPPVLARLGAEIGLPSADQEQVASNVSLETSDAPDTCDLAITIRGRGVSPAEAQTLAAAAARELMAAIDDREDRAAQRQDERISRSELRERRHYERRARLAIEEFLSTWQPAAPPAKQEVVVQDEPPVEPSLAEQQRKSSMELAQTFVINPQWEQLAAEVYELEQELQLLLTRMQPQHPEVQQAEFTLRERQRQLHFTPRTLQVAPASFVGQPTEQTGQDGQVGNTEQPNPPVQENADDAPAPGRQATTTSDLVANVDSADETPGGLNDEVEQPWRAKLAELTENYRLAVAEREEAERRSDEAVRDVLASNHVVRSWQVVPATVVSRTGGGISRERVIGLLLLAVGTGALVFWLARIRRQPATFPTSQDLQAAVELPVLTEFAGGDGVEHHQPVTSGSGPMRMLTKAAESVVLLHVGAMLIVLATGNPLLRDLLADPFGATADVVPRLLDCWR
jgi:hypothetical protein